MYERLARAITAGPLPEDLRKRALGVLGTLPDGAALCHGDFHPDNVLLTAGGPVIIDWLDATRGAPAADVARSSILMRLGTLPPGTAKRGVVEVLRRRTPPRAGGGRG